MRNVLIELAILIFFAGCSSSNNKNEHYYQQIDSLGYVDDFNYTALDSHYNSKHVNKITSDSFLICLQEYDDSSDSQNCSFVIFDESLRNDYCLHFICKANGEFYRIDDAYFSDPFAVQIFSVFKTHLLNNNDVKLAMHNNYCYVIGNNHYKSKWEENNKAIIENQSDQPQFRGYEGVLSFYNSDFERTFVTKLIDIENEWYCHPSGIAIYKEKYLFVSMFVSPKNVFSSGRFVEVYSFLYTIELPSGVLLQKDTLNDLRGVEVIGDFLYTYHKNKSQEYYLKYIIE